MKMHTLARSEINPAYKGKRAFVPDSHVDWKVSWPTYTPVNFTHPIVKSAPVWADLPDPQSNADLKNRTVYGELVVDDKTGFPLNPMGRTGTCGRGLLGKWGPNYAADPIVMYQNHIIMIKRKDTGEWALPGGMVDPNEKVITAAIRELIEEACGSGHTDVYKIFSDINPIPVYTGYVDDPRNTDNAWMETGAFLFKLSKEQFEKMPPLVGSDDALAAGWFELDMDGKPKSNYKYYANHLNIIKNAVMVSK